MPVPPPPPPRRLLCPCRAHPLRARTPRPCWASVGHLCARLCLTQGEAHPGAGQSVRGERPAGPGRGPCARTPSGREAAGRPGGHSVSALSKPTPARTHASTCGSGPQRLPSTSTPRPFPAGSPAAFLGRGLWHSVAGAGPGAAHGSLLLPRKPSPCLRRLLPAHSVDTSGRPTPRICRGAAFRRQMSWRTGEGPFLTKDPA